MVKYLKKILGITALENIILGQVVINQSFLKFVNDQDKVNKAIKTYFETLKAKGETVIIDLNDPIDEDKYN